MTAFPRFNRGFAAWAPAAFALAALCLLSTTSFAAPESRDAREREREREREAATRSVAPVPGIVRGAPARLIGSAVVNLAELARLEALGLGPAVQPGGPRVLIRDAEENEMEIEPGANVLGPVPSEAMAAPPPFVPFVSSPSPSSSFMGLDDVPMADSGYVIIPPDVAGGVGLTKVMESFNNNYRIRDKGTGATQLTLGTATFWAAVTPVALRNQLTDPRTTYDPYNNRWIACMQSVNTNGDIYVGVSQTSDPAGSWFLYRFTGFSASYLIDFPILGFNKNWIAITINRYTTAPAFSAGICLTVNYPQARAGAGSGTLFSQAAGTHFCTAPCATISATEDTLFLVTHLSSGGATYQVDRITGTAASPVYTSGGTSTRPGGGWVQPSGNLLPQSAPNAGVSACGATPCPIETQDAQVRSAPVYRVDSTTGQGFIYYTQTVGLPNPSLTHTAVQWTKVTASTTPAFADGGRIEDPTATSSNGGKWYAFPHIAVNAVGDFIVGYTQYSSAQHPAAGYSVHIASEGLGTIRDALLYHPGDDYYHKTFTTTTGRNRWGDFSTAQVDPADDRSLWVLQEHGKTRTGTDDGNTGSNSSRWSSWWANVAGPAPTVTIAPGPSVNEGNAGTTSFNFTVNLSTAYSVPVTVNFQTSDGSATVADNDYQAATSSIVIPVGSSSGTITVLVNGDTKCEGSETFTVTLTGATNGTVGSPGATTGTILNDETSKTITATAGTGGTITPSGASSFACGANQTYTISPADKCHVISDVKVDGVSVGVVASYTFTNIIVDHTIDATFAALGPFTVTATAGAGGSITPSGATLVACGGGQGYTISPADKCHVIGDVKVDGVSVGAVASYTLTDVQANHTIDATFAALGPFTVTATAGAGGSITPSGATLVACGGAQGYTISPADKCHVIGDVKVDGVSVGAVASYTLTDVQANHTIDATFTLLGPFTVTATAGAGGSILGPTSVACGASQKYSIEPADKCHVIGDVKVDGVSVGAVASYTLTDVQANHTIDATFTLLGPFTVTATAGAGGSILGPASVACGASQKYSIEPADKCHVIGDVKVDGVSVGAVASYTLTDVQANHTIDATFTLLGPFTVTATAGAGGSILGPASVACGASQKYSIEPADKCHVIGDVKVDGVSVGAVASYTLTDVQANHTIDATFAALGPFTVTATAGAGGSILGPASVACGASQKYDITPNAGFMVSDVKVDGLSVGPLMTYTLTDVQANHTIDATFTEIVAVLEASFQATTVDEGVELRWHFSSFVSPSSVTLERADAPTGHWAPVPVDVSFDDEMAVAIDRGTVAGRSYYYRLSVAVSHGQVASFGPAVGVAGSPIRELALTSIAPNPSSGSVQIEYALPRGGPVQVSVLDIQGRTVSVLTTATQPRGRFRAVWSGETARGRAPAGMYFVRLQSAGQSVVRRLALVR